MYMRLWQETSWATEYLWLEHDSESRIFRLSLFSFFEFFYYSTS